MPPVKAASWARSCRSTSCLSEAAGESCLSEGAAELSRAASVLASRGRCGAAVSFFERVKTAVSWKTTPGSAGSRVWDTATISGRIPCGHCLCGDLGTGLGEFPPGRDGPAFYTRLYALQEKAKNTGRSAA